MDSCNGSFCHCVLVSTESISHNLFGGSLQTPTRTDPTTTKMITAPSTTTLEVDTRVTLAAAVVSRNPKARSKEATVHLE